jgi:predicted PurR-regulated permease PerM
LAATPAEGSGKAYGVGLERRIPKGNAMRIERQFVFWTSALLVLIGMLLLLRHILLPFVVGAALAYLLDPLANLLIRRGINRLVAALLIIALFVIVFAGILVLIAPVLVDQLAAFVGKLPGYLEKLQALVADPNNSWLLKTMGGTSGAAQGSLGVLMNKLVGYLTDMLSTLWTKGEALLSLLSLFVITPVVTFYLLVDWNRVVSSLDSLIPLPQRQTVYELVAEINKALSGYVRGQLLVCVVLGIYYAVGLTLAGLNFGLLIGVVSGFLTFIPYVGSLTALVVSSAVAVAQFYPDWTHILVVVGVILVGQFLEGNVLSPKLVGGSVGLHPVWLIFALLAFGYLFGFVGLLLAVPLAAAIGVLTRFAIARYRSSAFYTGNGST